MLLVFSSALCCAETANHRRPRVLVLVHTAARLDNVALSTLIRDSIRVELESRGIDPLQSDDPVTDSAALADLGGKISADYALWTTYSQTGSAIRLDARWIDVASRAESGQWSRTGELNLSFDSLVAGMVDELVDGQKESIARLPPPDPPVEAQPLAPAAPGPGPVAAPVPPAPASEPRIPKFGFSLGSAPFIATFAALNYFPVGLALSVSGHYQVRAPGGFAGFGLASGVNGFHGKGAYSQADFYVIPIGVDLLYGTRNGSRIDFYVYARGGPAVFTARLQTGEFLAKVIPFVQGGVGITVTVVDPVGLSLDGSYTSFFDSPDPIMGFTPSLSLVVKL